MNRSAKKLQKITNESLRAMYWFYRNNQLVQRFSTRTLGVNEKVTGGTQNKKTR
jgi:hypothetical protein